MIKSLLLVGLGGGLGSIGRYLMSLLIQKNFSLTFPLGTFLVNILGSLLIGLLIGYAGKNLPYSPDIKLLFITGFCGGFTTFSTFSAENFHLIQNGQYGTTTLYIFASITLGILAMASGWMITK